MTDLTPESHGLQDQPDPPALAARRRRQVDRFFRNRRFKEFLAVGIAISNGHMTGEDARPTFDRFARWALGQFHNGPPAPVKRNRRKGWR